MLYVGSEEGKVLRIRNMIVNSDVSGGVLLQNVNLYSILTAACSVRCLTRVSPFAGVEDSVGRKH